MENSNMIENVKMNGVTYRLRPMSWKEQIANARKVVRSTLISPSINIEDLDDKTLFDLFFEVIRLTDQDTKTQLEMFSKVMR